MLIEIVEVIDSEWQTAVEALLAPYRQLILLENEADRAEAWHIGEKLRYRHFVAAERAAPSVPQTGDPCSRSCASQLAPLGGWLRC